MTVYRSRQLRGEQTTVAAFAGGGIGEVEQTDEFASFIARASEEPFTAGVTRGNICVFLAGGADELEQIDVSVQSVMDFVPGVRVAVAANDESLGAYERYVNCVFRAGK